MKCERFLKMDEDSRRLLMAKLSHAVSVSNVSFDSVLEILADAEQRNLFNGVQFLMETKSDQYGEKNQATP